MAGGWIFNNNVASYELVKKADQYHMMLFKDMNNELLDALLKRLAADNDKRHSTRWAGHIDEIRQELETKIPPKIITSVTVKSGLIT